MPFFLKFIHLLLNFLPTGAYKNAHTDIPRLLLQAPSKLAHK